MQIHGNGVEARDEGHRIVECKALVDIGEIDGVGTTVRNGKEGVARCPCKARSQAAEYIRGIAILQRIRQSTKVSKEPGIRLGQFSNCDQYRLRRRWRLGAYKRRRRAEQQGK